MKLVSLRLQRFKRFREATHLKLDGEVIALVGRNESGKSSLLQALTHLNDDRSLERDEISHDLPRDDEEEFLQAVFALGEEDHELIKETAGGEQPRWFTVTKTEGGVLSFKLQPPLGRDLRPRKRVLKELIRLVESPWLRGIDERDSVKAALAEAIDQLRMDEESFSPSTKAALSTIGSLLDEAVASSDSNPKYVQRVSPAVASLLQEESRDHPQDVACKALWVSSPLILQFRDESRSLASSYDLEDVADDPPEALANLANLSDLDLETLLELINEEDFAAAQTLTHQANSILDGVFNEAWQQSDVRVHFSLDGTMLRIFIADKGGNYTSIAERSDGLRAFVALIAFVSLQSEAARPILLVDEAETHLHYEAQADLIRMFTKQQAAAQVIYTTHSAGCLPQDLGRGIRLISASNETDSEVVNEFWEKGAGLSPILLAMGASTLAFASARFAVISEGPSDVVLLPTLLREVLNLKDIGFQVAPGAATASRETLKELELEAVRVAYLVDGDPGGVAVAAKLRNGGIPERRILRMGGAGSGLTIEDLVKKSLYAKAVNDELHRSYGGPKIPASEISSKRRSRSVEEWCKTQGLKPPRKVAVAYRLLDMASDTHVVDQSRRGIVQRLHRSIANIVGIDLPKRF